MNSGRGVVGLILASLLVVVGCSSASSATSVPSASLPTAPVTLVPAGRTQTNDAGGQVTAKATWNGPAAGAIFDLALDTDSVDLDALDLADAVLRNDRGETMSGQPWSAPAGGHHREGMLSFAGDATAFFSSAQWIELVLYDIEGVPEGHALGDRLVTSLTGGYSSALAISPRSMAFGAVAAGALLLVYLAIVSLAQAAARSS